MKKSFHFREFLNLRLDKMINYDYNISIKSKIKKKVKIRTMGQENYKFFEDFLKKIFLERLEKSQASMVSSRVLMKNIFSGA